MSKIAFEKAEPIIDFPRNEEKIRSFWKEHRIFETSVSMRKGQPNFIWDDGPPTANGKPHNGHVLTRVFKDIYPRYRTMRGYHVERVAGWDTHGLPVEVEVEKEIGIHGKAAIEQYGEEAFVKRCIESVFRYIQDWERVTEQMGHWVDLSNAYVTYHKSYVESVWWALSKLLEKNLLYRGHKVVWWWAQGGTALSSAEVGLGYKTTDDPSVYVEFPLLEAPDVSLLVWTTTPWTLPSNMYAAVKPDVDYVVVEFGTKKLILAAALREVISGKLKCELPIIRQLKGEALVGKRYQPPYSDYYRQFGQREVTLKTDGQKVPALWKVLAANFVDLEQGTGLVHEAPAFGEVDHDLHQSTITMYEENDIPLLCAVGPDGKFNSEIPSLTGQWVKDADREILRTLRKEKVLVHQETYRHEYPFCWRADQDPLIQYARPAWFIRTTSLKQEAILNNQAVNWLPEHIKEGRFGDFLSNNVDWALSRERYWGTPLNIWVNDVTGRMTAPCSVEEILEKNPNAFEAFQNARDKDPSLSEHLIVHKPWIDQVTWVEPGEAGVYRRVPEVIDCWFDSGSMPFAQWGYPHKGHQLFDKTFPADYIVEAIDQTRGWFYSMLMISTLLFDKATQKELSLHPRVYPHPFKTCIVLGHVNDPDGKKESKSKGNYTSPDVILDKVAMEFAVISSDGTNLEPQAGVALIAREDLQGLDITQGSSASVYKSNTQEAALSLRIEQGKGLPRRVVILSDEDRSKIAVECVKNGMEILPAEVPRLREEARVIIEDVSTPAPGADAFRWFFLAANPPGNPKRHSLGNVRALQKEFLIKLRNVYSFFTIYASIDGFDPREERGRAIPERSDLDRWILSELSSLNRRLIENLDNYRSYEAARDLAEFVDGLSNWYLRRSRSRFWSDSRDTHKFDAYATLYEILVTLAKIAAPFVPFMTEEIYQNLVHGVYGSGVPKSIHLCDFPEPDLTRIDGALNEEMKVVRDIVSLGLRVRTDQRLKVRQPLSRAEITLSDSGLDGRIGQYLDLIAEELNVRDVVLVHGEEEHVEYGLKPNFRKLGPRVGKKMNALKDELARANAESIRRSLFDKGEAHVEVNGEAISLTLEDVEVVVRARDGYAASGDQTAVVVLLTELTPDLIEEGKYREVLNRVQSLRKDLGLEFTQRIRIAVCGSESISQLLESRREHFMKEVLATELSSDDSGFTNRSSRNVEIYGDEVTLLVEPL